MATSPRWERREGSTIYAGTLGIKRASTYLAKEHIANIEQIVYM
jgi:hypothetical protein